MIARIEIDGFKTFAGFSLDLQPFTAIVEPNASGKSNLFDALRFLSLLARENIHAAMQGRGRPEEFFRKTETGICENMTFAVEVLLEPTGVDAFGTKFEVIARRIRYELTIGLARNAEGMATGVFFAARTLSSVKKIR
jgi:predicted ATPase